MTTELVPQRTTSAEIRQLADHAQLLGEMYASLLQEGTDYGKVPGTDKPTLLKPGAELLRLWMKLAPHFEVKGGRQSDGHYLYEITCCLTNSEGDFIGEGVGSCSTYESKYRYRDAKPKCPACGKTTIFKDKKGGWFCWRKQGGCGENYLEGNQQIESQPIGKVENPDVADQANTVLKMAKKRAFVDAILTVTGASRIFTQDVEDFTPVESAPVPPPEDLGKYAKAKGPEHVQAPLDENAIPESYLLAKWKSLLNWGDVEGKADLLKWSNSHGVTVRTWKAIMPSLQKQYLAHLNDLYDQLTQDSEEAKGQ